MIAFGCRTRPQRRVIWYETIWGDRSYTDSRLNSPGWYITPNTRCRRMDLGWLIWRLMDVEAGVDTDAYYREGAHGQ